MFDLEGNVIGINSALISPTGASVGIGLAIPAELAKPVIDALMKGQRPQRGYLGVGTYPTGQGALVSNVEDGGPAATAGILVGDIIVAVAGAQVGGPDSLRTALGDRPGEAIKIAIVRAGQRQELDVTLGSKS